MGEEASECNIKVICRVRPLNNAEKDRNDEQIVTVPTDETCHISGGQGSRTFTFDRVFKPSVDQETVYTHAAKPIVGDVLSGFNGTIFAYGQTSSGKTHTMEGVLNDQKMQGIIPRIVGDIFNHIYSMDENLEFHIKVCYYEIYMEKIRDLLDPTKTNLPIHEDKNKVPYVKGITERFVTCPEEVMSVIDEGKSNRHIAVTNMNEHSSRSHSIFQIQIKQENEVTQKKLSGKLYLVDLAGSEKVSKTGATGETLDEAKNINKSLSCLGNVISSLAEGTKSHIPYRDSKLTRILQESLGGNSRTTMVICCSPASYNESETRSTLLFGQRTKTIKNVVCVNEELTAEEWKRRYERERERSTKLKAMLQAALAELERWRAGEKVDPAEQGKMELAVPGGESAGVSPSASLLSIMTLGGGGSQASLAPEQVRLNEEEKAKLYSQLDERDDEIATQAQLVERLRQQMLEQEAVIVSSRQEQDKLQTEVFRLQEELDSTKEEVKEVLQALEELAVNFDQKSHDLEEKTAEIEKIASENKDKQDMVKKYEQDLFSTRDEMTSLRGRIEEMMSSLTKELHSVCHTFADTTEFQHHMQSSGKLEEEFTVARIYINKMKSEIKNLSSQNASLENTRSDLNQKLNSTETELSMSRLQVQQHEAKLASLEAQMAEVERARRALEKSVDEKEDAIRSLRASESYERSAKEKTLAEKEGKLKSADEMRVMLESELEVHRDNHQKQLAHLRDEIADKNKALEQLKNENQNLQLSHQLASSELERVKKEETEKSHRLALLQADQARRDQAREDLESLEETVTKELQTLHNLRRLFVEDLQNRFKKGAANTQTDSEGIPIGSTAMKQINFLETNLDTLTKVHRQLVKDNADLRTELPKLERRLKTTGERVKHLETSLKEAKEGALKERARYQSEVEKIKEAVRQRNINKRGNISQQGGGGANIVKAVRPGQQQQQQIRQPQVTVPQSIRGGGSTAGESAAAPTHPRIPAPILGGNRDLSQGLQDMKIRNSRGSSGSGPVLAGPRRVPNSPASSEAAAAGDKS